MMFSEKSTPASFEVSNEAVACEYQNPYLKIRKADKDDRIFLRSYGDQDILIQCKKDLAAALVGPWFIVRAAQGKLQQRLVGTFGQQVRLVNSGDVVMAQMGPWILASDGESVLQKYIGTPDGYEDLIATPFAAAAIMGKTFVTYRRQDQVTPGQLQTYYVGSSDMNNQLIASANLIAARMGPILLVWDGPRGACKSHHIGESGKIQFIGEDIHDITPSGRRTIYKKKTGIFQ